MEAANAFQERSAWEILEADMSGTPGVSSMAHLVLTTFGQQRTPAKARLNRFSRLFVYRTKSGHK